MYAEWRKRAFAALTVGLALAALLVAAGPSIRLQKPVTQQKKEEEEHQADLGTLVPLTLFSDVEEWNVPEWSLKSGSFTRQITDLTGISIEAMTPAQNADQQLSLLLTTNRLPDLITVEDPNIIRQLISSGKVWNLRSFFTEYDPDSRILKEYPKELIARLRDRDGGWYAISSGYHSLDLLVNQETVIWNRKYLHRLGVMPSEIRTKDDVLRVFTLCQNQEPDVIPLIMNSSDLERGALKFFYDSFGGIPVDDDGTYRFYLDTAEGKEALSFVNTLMRRGFLDTNYMTYDEPQIAERMAQEEVLCYIGDISHLKIDPGEWISTGAVLSDDGRSPVLALQNASCYGWCNTFVSTSCTDLEGAARFLEQMICGPEVETKEGDSALDDWWIFRTMAWETGEKGESLSTSDALTRLSLRGVYSEEEGLITYPAVILNIPAKYFSSHPSLERSYMTLTERQDELVPWLLASRSEAEFANRYAQALKEMEDLGLTHTEEALKEPILENEHRFGSPKREVKP
ncbi:MAG: hypothetical protein VZQ80_04940 [Lachnospiraceae bacterium]|nr:hypothetical protein [Lachnospiraceae bacterium]